jgi:hypothetical protein
LYSDFCLLSPDYFNFLTSSLYLCPMNQEKLNWKEKYSALILLLIGFFFLVTQTFSFISSQSERMSTEGDKLNINLSELKSDLKIYIVVILAILGGVLLLYKRRLGWILGLPVLLWYAILAINGIVMSVALRTFDLSFILVLVGFTILAFAIGFLYTKSAREKYKVGKQTYLPTFLILLAIVAIYFWL